jgi:hypothetical protein
VSNLTIWSVVINPPKASLGPKTLKALVVFQNTVRLDVNLGSS